MKNLAKAILAVMKEVKGIDKTMTVGSGQNSYKGVPDQEVKKVIGEAMQKNGLCLIPTGVENVTKIERWEETGGQYGPKQKQSVFTEVKTKYLLLHESGESLEVAGYGHGTDSQDKSAGKATTYALKYVLLYLFLVPTGKIEDTESTHSDTMDVPKNGTHKLTQDRDDAIKKLAKCYTVDELVLLKETLPNYIISDVQFVKAATARHKEITKKEAANA